MSYFKDFLARVKENSTTVFAYLIGLIFLLFISFQVFILLLQLSGEMHLIDKIFNQLEKLVGYKL